MRVLFEEEALNDRGSARSLTRIFELFEDGLHRWVVEEPAIILQSHWFKSLGTDVQRRVRTQLDNADPSPLKNPRVHRQLLRVSPRMSLTRNDWWVPTQRAYSYLKDPVTVLVENLECDGTFFRVLMLRYAEKKWNWLSQEERDVLFSAWNTPRGDSRFFRVEHGGGANISDMIRITYNQSRAVDLPPRLLILVDSDLLVPPPSHHELTLRAGSTAHTCENVCRDIQTLGNNHSRYYAGYRPNLLILRKREAENYLPLPAVMKRAARMHTRATAFAQLNDIQKDYFDMKSGLQSSLQDPSINEPNQWMWKARHEEHGALFSGVPEDRLRELHGGFGSGIWEGFQEDHNCVNRKTLQERGGEELEQIVDAAFALL